MNRLVIQNGNVFLDDKEIQGITALELKSSTDGTAELSLKVIVDLVSMSINQHKGDEKINLAITVRKDFQQAVKMAIE